MYLSLESWVSVMIKKISSVKVKNLKGNVPTLYHLSFNGDLPGELVPRLPDGMEVGKASEAGKYKENKFPEPDWISRVSFSTSIHGCVVATYPNWWPYFEDKKYNYPYVEMWVYAAILERENTLVTPDTLMAERLVWDVPATHEWWVLDNVKIERVGKIRVHNANKEPPLYIHPYGDESMKAVECGPKKFRLS